MPGRGVRRRSGKGEGQARVGGSGRLPLLVQPARSTLHLSEELRFPPLQLRLGVLVGLCKCPSLIAQKGRQCSAGIELGRQLLVGAPCCPSSLDFGACLELRALVVYTSGRL